MGIVGAIKLFLPEVIGLLIRNLNVVQIGEQDMSVAIDAQFREMHQPGVATVAVYSIDKRAKKEIKARMPEEGSFATGVEGVGIHRRDVQNDPHKCLYGPRIIYILQGYKHTTVGNDEYCYGENDLFISGVDLPNSSHIVTASVEDACMSLIIDLDRSMIGQLALEFPLRGGASEAGFSLVIQPIDTQILDALLRLEAVFDNPDEITILGPDTQGDPFPLAERA